CVGHFSTLYSLFVPLFLVFHRVRATSAPTTCPVLSIHFQLFYHRQRSEAPNILTNRLISRTGTADADTFPLFLTALFVRHRPETLKYPANRPVSFSPLERVPLLWGSWNTFEGGIP